MLIDIHWPSDYSAVVSNGHAFLEYVASALTVSMQTEGYNEGVRAVVEKRAPPYKGHPCYL
mgnify:CR=1 FL=1